MLKYFLNRDGIPTKRIAGRPDAGHIDIANAAEKLDQASDIYQQMFKMGYARVVEDNGLGEIHADSPRQLTSKQKAYLEDRRFETKMPVLLNDRRFIESRTKHAVQVAANLLK